MVRNRPGKRLDQAVRLLLACLLIGAGFWLFGCEPTGGEPDALLDTPEEFVCEGGAVMPFNPRPSVNYLPWPIDLLTVEDEAQVTGRRLNLNEAVPPILTNLFKELTFLKDALNRVGGFSTTSRIFIPTGGDLIQYTLPERQWTTDPSASVQLIIADPDSPDYGRQVRCEVLYRPQLSHIQITPEKPLFGNTRYAVVVTKQVLDSGGLPVCCSDEFAYLMSRAPDPERKYFNDLEPVRQKYEELFDFLADREQPILREQIAVAFEFSTTDTTTVMEHISYMLNYRAEFMPPEPFKRVILPGDRAGLNAIVKGLFMAPEFRDKEGVFSADPETGLPFVVTENGLEFLLLLPDPEPGGPTQPFPVLLVMHGIDASKELAYSLMPQLARMGMASMSTDMVWHGSRAKPGSPLATFNFLKIFDPLAMRDNMRQTVSDQLQTIQLIKTMSELDVYPYDPETGLYGDGIADLDTSKIMTFSHSLGSIMTPLVTALTPDVMCSVANADAGHWGDVIRYSEYVVDAIDILGWFIEDFEFPESMALLIDMYNIILDPIDNFNYIQHVLHEPLPVGETVKDTLFTVGIGDLTLPNESAYGLARVADVPLVTPCVEQVEGLDLVPSPVVGTGLWQFPTDNHNFYFSGSDPFRDSARRQAEAFWASCIQDGRGLIINPDDPAQITE